MPWLDGLLVFDQVVRGVDALVFEFVIDGRDFSVRERLPTVIVSFSR